MMSVDKGFKRALKRAMIFYIIICDIYVIFGNGQTVLL